jgi:endogenous inhibitor of DNA gyrase (YacG/DUF329 family)
MSPQAGTAPSRGRCPRCGKPAPGEGNPWRPFCSERCKQIDLAAWAEGEYAIAGEALPPEGEPEA